MLLERAAIDAAIRDSRGNISDAAKRLGVARRTLQNRMRAYGIPVGTSGRPKRKIAYRRHSRAYAIGAGVAAVAAVAFVATRGSKA